MVEQLLEPKLYESPPAVCTKPGCGGTIFLPHEDGWQCFNCMKIIYKYKASPKVDDPNVFKRLRRHRRRTN